MDQIASIFFAALCTGTVLFHLSMIAGAPFGRYTQGGKYDGPLPTSGRVFAGVAILMVLAMGLAILSAAGYWPRWTGWATLALMIFSVIFNWITPSVQERRLWGPITALILLMALITMFS